MDEVLLPSVCVLYDEEQHYHIVPKPETLPDLAPEAERSSQIEAPDDGKQDKESSHDEPILCHQIAVQSLQSETAIITRITQLYCKPNKCPKVISHTPSNFELRMASEDLKLGTRRYNGFVPLEAVPRSLIEELEAGEESATDFSTHGNPEEPTKGKREGAQEPNGVVKEQSSKEHERTPSTDNQEEIAPADWILDYMAKVARTGRSPLPWDEIHPPFMAYLKNVLYEKLRRYDNWTANSKEPIIKADCDELSRLTKFVCSKVETFDDFPVTFRRLCEILASPPRCYADVPSFINAVKKLVDVDITASLYSPPKSGSTRVKKRRAFSRGESKLESLPVNEPMRGINNGPVPDLDGGNAAHKRSSKKLQSDKHKRHTKADCAPVDVTEQAVSKKPKQGKK
ncbi:hypothetical protein Aduo_019602 [Ancylostoma duodenale]